MLGDLFSHLKTITSNRKFRIMTREKTGMWKRTDHWASVADDAIICQVTVTDISAAILYRNSHTGYLVNDILQPSKLWSFEWYDELGKLCKVFPGMCLDGLRKNVNPGSSQYEAGEALLNHDFRSHHRRQWYVRTSLYNSTLVIPVALTHISESHFVVWSSIYYVCHHSSFIPACSSFMLIYTRNVLFNSKGLIE